MFEKGGAHVNIKSLTATAIPEELDGADEIEWPFEPPPGAIQTMADLQALKV